MTVLIKCNDAFMETRIDEEVVVMDMTSGDFFSLTETSLAIWQLIDGVRDRNTIVAVLVDEYAADRDSVSGEVDTFIAALTAAGFVSTG